LTLGIVVGIVRLARSGHGFDALIAVTLLTWMVYGVYLTLRLVGWQGRRAAYVALIGFALVIVVRLGLPVTHFGG
jgi:ABC-type transport system involved in cytochrome c biogenesis permease subunit